MRIKHTTLLITLSISIAACSSQIKTPQVTSHKPSAVTVEKETPLQNIIIAEIALRQQNLETALEYYDKALAEIDNLEITRKAAQIAHQLNKPAIAQKHITKWLSHEPDNIIAHGLMLTQLIRQNKAEETKPHWQQILQQSEKKLPLFLSIIKGITDSVPIHKVNETLQPILTATKKNKQLFITLAWISLEQDDSEQAKQYIDKLLKQTPNDTQTILFKATIEEKAGTAQDAINFLKKQLKAYPNNEEVRLEYAKYLIEQEALQKGIKQYEYILKGNPRHAKALFGKALISIDLKKYSQATKTLNTLKKHHKSYTNAANYYLGIAAERQNKLTQAISHFKKVTPSEYHLKSKVKVAQVLAAQGKIKSARDFLHNIIPSTNYEVEQLALVEVDILQKQDQWSAALIVVNHTLAKLPNNHNLLYTRAIIYERLDEIDKLEEDLKFIINDSPDHATALNALGYTLVDRTNRIEEGLTYIKKALSIEPENPAIMDSLGWAKFKKGKYAQAINLFKTALQKLNNDDPEIESHLIKALWHNNEKEQAKKYWQEALKKHKNNRHIKKLDTLFNPEKTNENNTKD